MIRLRLLIPLILFLSLSPGGDHSKTTLDYSRVQTFLIGTMCLVMIPALVARVVARSSRGANVRERMLRVNRLINFFRYLVPLWFAAGLWHFQWGLAVRWWMRAVPEWMMTPAVVVGTAPAIFAWVGLIWAQHPSEVLLRRSTVLDALEDDFPVYLPARLSDYLDNQIRMQILSTIFPLLVALLLHDLAAGVLVLAKVSTPFSDAIETILFTGAMAVVFLTSPRLLRLVFRTEPLPDSPLRSRLEALFARTRLRCQDILLWHTHRNVANAMVAGPTRWFRYIFLSDLLMETLSDEQIEAVFAHEAGHIAHHHISWYLAFVLTVTMSLAGPNQWLENYLKAKGISPDTISSAMGLAMFLLFWTLFGMLSRRFERQADVYAARTLQMGLGTAPPPGQGSPDAEPAPDRPTGWPVGPEGADTFASALLRVAIINNIPLAPRPREPGFRGFLFGRLDRLAEFAQRFLHGSITSRMDYVRSIADDPEKTFRFDRRIRTLKICLFIALLVSGGCAYWVGA